MKREIKEKIDALEEERDSIVTFIDEIEGQIKEGNLTDELAKEIYYQEFAGRNPRDLIVDLNQQIAELRTESMMARPRLAPIAVPVAVVLVLGLVFAFGFPAITGLFIDGGEQIKSLQSSSQIEETGEGYWVTGEGVTAPIKETCLQNTDCSSGVCKDNFHQGTLSSKVCVTSENYCVAQRSEYEAYSIFDESLCIVGSTGGAWVVAEERGRFTVRNARGEAIAVIDRHGSMLLSGNALFGTTVGSEGWLVKDSQNMTRLSIDNSGNLRSEGALQTRALPEPTAAGDFVIRDTLGRSAAVITQRGDVFLAGDLVEGVDLI